MTTGQGESDDFTIPPKPRYAGLKAYHPEEHRDKVRQHIAYWMLAILSLVIVFAGVVFLTIDADAVARFSGSVISPVVGMVGTVMGFYFGSKHSTDSPTR